MLHRREVDVARRLAPRALDLQPGKAAVDGLVDGRRRIDRLAVRTTSARSSFRKAACRPAGSALRPWPASRPTARPGCWPSHAPCRAPSSEPCGRRRTGAWGDISGPSGHPGVKRSDRRSGADYGVSNVGQHPSSSCLPVRCWQVLSSSRCATSFQTALRPYNADCIGGLDFHGPLAAAAADAQDMALDFRKTSLPHLGPGRAGARVVQDRFPVFGRQGRIRSRSGGARSAGGFSGQFFHLLWGRHAPARGSVGHAEIRT